MGNDFLVGRRAFLTRASSLAGAAAFSATSGHGQAAASETVVVKTTKGQLRGARDKEFIVFKGVPYAGPSDGENRFKPPTRQEPWTGVRDALEYGHQAIQNRDPNSLPGSSQIGRAHV